MCCFCDYYEIDSPSDWVKMRTGESKAETKTVASELEEESEEIRDQKEQ